MRRLAIVTTLAALAMPAYAQSPYDRNDPYAPYDADDRTDRYDRDRYDRDRYDRDRYDRDRDRYDRDRDRDWNRRDRDRYGRDQRGVTYPRDRYDRFDRSRWSGYRGRWVPLARDLPARQPMSLNLGQAAGRYQAIRIEAERGAPAIRGVYIEFANGRRQWVGLGTRLRQGAGEVIDLRGDRRRIDRVIVYGDPRSRGTYSVFAG